MDLGYEDSSSSDDEYRQGSPDLSPRERSPESAEREEEEGGQVEGGQMEGAPLLVHLRRELEDAREEIQEHENFVQVFLNDNNRLRERNTELNNELADARNTIRDSARELTRCRNELEYKDVVVQLKDEEIRTMNRKMEEMRTEMEDMRKEVKDSRKNVEEAMQLLKIAKNVDEPGKKDGNGMLRKSWSVLSLVNSGIKGVIPSGLLNGSWLGTRLTATNTGIEGHSDMPNAVDPTSSTSKGFSDNGNQDRGVVPPKKRKRDDKDHSGDSDDEKDK